MYIDRKHIYRYRLMTENFKDISNVRLKRGVFSTEIYLKSRFLSEETHLPTVDKLVITKNCPNCNGQIKPF